MADLAYLRFPHLSGNLLTFVAEDDVWLAPLDQALSGEARAWRLTTDRKPAAHPRLNPSGTHVAWSSNRDGAGEAYAVRVDGGPINRLTYWGIPWTANHGVRGWVSDTEVLVTSRTEYHTFHRAFPYAVPLDAPARRLPYGPAAQLSFSPDGAVLLNPMSHIEQAYWKRYGGGRGGQVWYSPDGTEFERILSEVGNNLVNPMWVAGRVVFLSDHEGVGALYSALPDGSDVRRHTDHGPYYARHATTDGTRVIYQCAGDLYLLNSLDADADAGAGAVAEPVKLNIRLGGVRSGRAPFPISAKSDLGDFALCKTGRIIAAEVRGTAHWLPAEDGPARTLLSQPGVRARQPIILPGTSTVVCVSDSDGEDGLDIIPADGSTTRRILSGELGRVMNIVAAPDAKTLAVSSDDGRLLIVDLEAETATVLSQSDVEEIKEFVFSPDSAFLAWTQPWQLWWPGAGHIRLARLSDQTIVDVTEPRFGDSSPAFTADGKYLAFLSSRTFDPAHDPQFFDVGFVSGVRPYLVGLAAETRSPFAPELNGRPAKPATADADKAEKDGGPVPVRVDLDGIARRVVPFPVQAGEYQSLTAADGCVLWLDAPRTGELGEAVIGGDEHPVPTLLRFDFAKRKLSTIVESLDSYAVSGDGKRLAYRKGTELVVRATEDKDDKDAITVDLDRIRVTVDPGAEWRQMYAEAWRLMRDNYWRADMGGVDWAGIGERYAPLVERIGSADDMHDLLWEMQGDIGSSHAYVMPPGQPGNPALAQGLLGADVIRDEAGDWRITRILPGENSVAAGRSPFEDMGVDARVGDLIVAVDGVPVDPTRGPNAALSGKAGKPVELTLRREGADDRRVVVVPTGDESALRYHALVQERRARVRELSGGRLGYLHVPDMQSAGWAELHRDLTTELAYDGIVLDLRGNGGGHLSDLVLERLNKKVTGWSLSRRMEPATYAWRAPRGPLVAVTDECAGSDGDIGTRTFKRLGLGSVVGTRTWGGVVGIDGKYSLVDGTGVTQPKYAFWFDDGVGWDVENYGVDPDIEVVITPQDWVAGRDPQLQEAVRQVLDELERNPAATPPPLPSLPSLP